MEDARDAREAPTPNPQTRPLLHPFPPQLSTGVDPSDPEHDGSHCAPRAPLPLQPVPGHVELAGAAAGAAAAVEVVFLP